jgi:hypothetical protein
MEDGEDMSSEKFYIYLPFMGFREIEEAKKFTIRLDGFEQFDVFIHRSHLEHQWWKITEGMTGLCITGGKTKAWAIDSLYNHLKGITPHVFRSVVDAAVKDHGISPRWEGRYQAGQ